MASHPSPPTPLSAAADAKRRRILDAARAVCARRGVDRARMDEIAAEARVSKGTLYNFFASKESLIVASILAHYERTELRVQAELGEPLPPAAQLDRLVESLIELFPDIIAEMVVNFQA